MRSNRRNGIGLIYMTLIMVVMCMLGSLAVDFGQVQVVKCELRRAADAAARAAAAHVPAKDFASANNSAVYIASQNLAGGQPVSLITAQDIEYGQWDATLRKFTILPLSSTKINAVHVTARRVAARNNAVPMTLARVLGKQSQDVKAETIVLVIPGVNVNQKVNATANPFLSGMPKGTMASPNNPHNSPDYAGDSSNPRQSAPRINGLPINEGEALTFDTIDGTARHDPSLPFFNPDGELTDIGTNTAGSEHGIADTRAPINALVGIFLDDRQPNTSSAPARLDFSSDASRNFTKLKPGLKQIFYIGDGLDSSGKRQEFIVPKGATRLYLATWDFFEWNNNAGSRTIKVERPQKIMLVK